MVHPMTWIWGADGEMALGEGSVTVGTGARISWYVRSAPERIVWSVAGRDRRVVEKLGQGMWEMLMAGNSRNGLSLVEKDWDTELWVMRSSVAADFVMARKLENFRARVELGRMGV